MIEKANACCFTGHRVIARESRDALPRQLDLQIRHLIDTGTIDFITGGALGFDTLAAQTVLHLQTEFPQIRLILALPCKDQDKAWTQAHRNRYRDICQRADEIYYLAERYSPGCMMHRNRFMVDNSTSCVFYLTNQQSGTYKTVAYAMEQNLNLYNILAVKHEI